MSRYLSAFGPVEGLEGLFSAQKDALRCTAIRLVWGDLCLYSPVLGLGDAALESLQALGEVTYLLAPNHYHHKGLDEYREAFPTAKVCCTAAAKTRLEKQTGLSFEAVHEAAPAFPGNTCLVEPRGLKTGEIWIRAHRGEQLVWIVTDAFCGTKGSLGAVVDRPQLLSTFPSFGIADREAYRDWLSEEIANRPPTMIVPCHGSVVAGQTIASDVLKLLQDLG
ncbi:hypothetical protein [Algihabitans albus]|uniref:hypothetical protein n=1 Tax=Algihabitans albus TaxID=2164067 RepID=UPI000E5CD663|nr:hypothetical protein [Algihabitans albus]